MPEIGECYSIAKKLNKFINNDKILKIESSLGFNSNIKIGSFLIKEIEHYKIIKIKAYGKSILFYCEKNNRKFILVSRLGMTGSWFINNFGSKRGHVHLKIFLKNKTISYSDPRMFGKISLFFGNNFTDIFNKIIKKNKWGIDPMIKNEKMIYLTLLKLKKSNQLIKIKLLEQNLIFGIGNYLASEILFQSKISPLRKCSSLTNSNIFTISSNIKKMVKLAYKKGGFSFAGGYILPDGSLGNLHSLIKVYGLDKNKCPNNCGGKIIKIFQNKRSTFFCKKCQK